MSKPFVRVRLEPSLEIQVITLSPVQRRALARVYERWARQLRVSAKILERDQLPRPKPQLRPLVPRRLRLN